MITTENYLDNYKVLINTGKWMKSTLYQLLQFQYLWARIDLELSYYSSTPLTFATCMLCTQSGPYYMMFSMLIYFNCCWIYIDVYFKENSPHTLNNFFMCSYVPVFDRIVWVIVRIGFFGQCAIHYILC